MKYLPTLIALLYSLPVCSQISESFDNTDLFNNSKWSGETNKFIIENGVLRLYDSLKTGSAFISATSKAVEEATWEWDFTLTFNPSSSNFLDVWLVSDSPAPGGNGLFVRMGSSADDISLYRSEGGVIEKIIDGTDDRLDHSSVSGKIRVMSERNGQFILQSMINQEAQFHQEGSTFVNSMIASYFIIHCNYTSTRSTRIYLDNVSVSGNSFRDTEPPTLLSTVVSDAHHILLRYSEPVFNAHQAGNYSLSSGQMATSVTEHDGLFNVFFITSLPAGKSAALHFENITDTAGNLLDTLLRFRYLPPLEIQSGELVINEIMPDPNPAVGLPESEYIELRNLTAYPLDLSSCEISDPSTSASLAGTWIDSMGYVLLHPGDDYSASNHFKVENCPSLNNSGDQLKLTCTGVTIDSLAYESNWHDPAKSGGGWSLEKISSSPKCSGPGDWTSSYSLSGGSPGLANPIPDSLRDVDPPEMLYSYYDDSLNHLNVTLSEPIYENEASHVTHPQVSSKFMLVEGEEVIIAFNESPNLKTSYETRIEGVTDCSDNSKILVVEWGVPEHAKPGDLVINEIMYEPNPGEPEWIELYNRSDKFLSLEKLFIKFGIDTISLSTLPRTIMPGELLLSSSDRNSLVKMLPYLEPRRVLNIQLPTLKNTGDNLVIHYGTGMIDSVNYLPEFHFELLQDTRGVSLERIDPDQGSFPHNWASASSRVGFSTPGLMNSHYTTEFRGLEKISVEPRAITPNNDGEGDLAIISYRLGPGSWVITCYVFDLSGNLVALPADHIFSASEGTITWDGIRNNGRKAEMGIYLVLLRALGDNGKLIELRDTLVVWVL